MYLSDVLTFEHLEQELESHNNRVCILAGVGAGKNYFIENIVAKNIREKAVYDSGNILYVSSRRMTVDGIKKQDELKEEQNTQFNERLNDRFFKLVMQEINTQHRFVTTNAMIEILLRTKNLNQILDHFDYFIFDECHSLFADATYSSAPFHVLKLIEHISKKQELSGKKIILMTGTKEPIKDYLQSNNWHILDYRDECENIKPKAIVIIKKKSAKEQMKRIVEDGKKIIYMTTTTNTKKIKELIPVSKNKTIQYAFCMNKEKEKLLESEERIKSEKVRDDLVNNRRLPKNIDILFCTSTLKEGVNIEDRSIKVAFCESHVLSDIQQFMGRVRTKLDKLYVIDDASQFFNYGEPIEARKYEYEFPEKYAIDVCNKYLENLSDENLEKYLKSDELSSGMIGFERVWKPANPDDYILSKMQYSYYCYCKEMSDFIDFIESKFDYMRFNHLINTFEIYQNKIDEEIRVSKYRDKPRDYITELEAFCSASTPVIRFSTAFLYADDMNHVKQLKEYIIKERKSKGKKDGYYGDDARNFKKSIYEMMNWKVGEQPQLNRINKTLKAFEIEYIIEEHGYGKNKHLKIVKA